VKFFYQCQISYCKSDRRSHLPSEALRIVILGMWAKNTNFRETKILNSKCFCWHEKVIYKYLKEKRTIRNNTNSTFWQFTNFYAHVSRQFFSSSRKLKYLNFFNTFNQLQMYLKTFGIEDFRFAKISDFRSHPYHHKFTEELIPSFIRLKPGTKIKIIK